MSRPTAYIVITDGLRPATAFDDPGFVWHCTCGLYRSFRLPDMGVALQQEASARAAQEWFAANRREDA